MNILIKKFSLLICCFLILSCASYQNNIRQIRKNPDEILRFKLYLENKYKINSFNKYETIWGTYLQTDTIISNFCLKNNILSIEKLPKKENEYYFNKYGNIVQLYFNNIYFLESNKSIIFDYTEMGLENYDKKLSKGKVADRIYIF